MRKLLSLLVVTIVAAVPAVAAESYAVDRVHSDVTFQIRHLISKVSGRFNEFDATLVFDRAKPENSKIDFVIRAESIDTKVADRDKHLRSEDFFDVAKYPEIRFSSTKIVPTGKERFVVTGNLTMHGVTRVVTLPVVFLGAGKDARGNERVGFETKTTLPRKDYGIVWNRTLDTGGVVLGDDVDVEIVLALVQQKKAE